MLAIITTPWQIRGAQDSREKATVHAAYNVLALGNPELSRQLHDDGSQRPAFSASLEGEGDDILRIGALEARVVAACFRALKDRPGTTAHTTTHQELLDKAGEDPIARFKILTPLLFRYSSTGRIEPLPYPAIFWSSLRSRWNQSGGPELPKLDFEKLNTGHYQIKTAPVSSFGPATEYGCVGSVSYWLPKGQERYFHALAAFAEYSGNGSRTAQGCGRIEYLIQPKAKEAKQDVAS